jgi:hypothetical protein
MVITLFLFRFSLFLAYESELRMYSTVVGAHFKQLSTTNRSSVMQSNVSMKSLNLPEIISGFVFAQTDNSCESRVALAVYTSCISKSKFWAKWSPSSNLPRAINRLNLKLENKQFWCWQQNREILLGIYLSIGRPSAIFLIRKVVTFPSLSRAPSINMMSFCLLEDEIK